MRPSPSWPSGPSLSTKGESSSTATAVNKGRSVLKQYKAPNWKSLLSKQTSGGSQQQQQQQQQEQGPPGTSPWQAQQQEPGPGPISSSGSMGTAVGPSTPLFAATTPAAAAAAGGSGPVGSDQPDSAQQQQQQQQEGCSIFLLLPRAMPPPLEPMPEPAYDGGSSPSELLATLKGTQAAADQLFAGAGTEAQAGKQEGGLGRVKVPAPLHQGLLAPRRGEHSYWEHSQDDSEAQGMEQAAWPCGGGRSGWGGAGLGGSIGWVQQQQQQQSRGVCSMATSATTTHYTKQSNAGSLVSTDHSPDRKLAAHLARLRLLRQEADALFN